MVWSLVSCLYSLAFAQGVFHTVAPEFLVVVDEREGQVNIEGVGSVGCCRPLPRLKRNHQVHPGSRPLDLKLVDEILPKDLTQQLLKFIVDPDRAIGTTWGKERIMISNQIKTCCNLRREKTSYMSFYLKPCRAPLDVPLGDGSDGQSGPLFLRHSPPPHSGHLHRNTQTWNISDTHPLPLIYHNSAVFLGRGVGCDSL